jgi:hypothetical protein
MKSVPIICLLFAGCVAQERPTPRFASLEVQAKTLCEVMKDPSRYAGRRVVVKAIYGRQPHQRVLYDPSCDEWVVPVGHSMTAEDDRGANRIVKRPAKKEPRGRVPVIYAGTFTVSHFLLDCTESDCYHYSLEDAQLLAASPR